MSVDVNTISLLHFDGNLTDETGRIWTSYGTPVVNTTSGMFGGGLSLNGTSHISTPKTSNLSFSGDFTIEAFINPFTIGSNRGIVSCISSPGNPWVLRIENGALGWYSGNAQYGSGGTIATNKYTHIAAVRTSSTITLYIAGLPVKTITHSGTLTVNSNLRIGSTYADTSESYYGMIDEVRISNIARYTSNFTPPTSPYSGGSTLFPQII